MNGRLSVVHRSLLSLGLILGVTPALPAHGALIDASIKASSEGATVRSAVTPFIASQVALLQKDDPAAQSAARDALITEAAGGPQRGPTVTYLDAYSEALNKALIPVMDSPNMRVRLNAAIVAARVAQAAQTHELADMAMKAMGDKEEAVVVWGLQIVRYTLPSIAKIPTLANQDKLAPRVVEVMKQNPSAIITQYGYDALSLDVIETARTRPWSPEEWHQALSYVVPKIQQALENRLALYQNGVPDDPQKEKRPANVLVEQHSWAAQNADDRTRTIQLLLNLMSFATHRAQSAKDNTTRDQLIELTVYTARAISTVPDLAPKVAGVVGLPRGAGADAAALAVQTAVVNVRQIYPKVQNPPVLREVAVEIKPPEAASTEPSILPAAATQPTNIGGPALPAPATTPAGAHPPTPPGGATHPPTGAGTGTHTTGTGGATGAGTHTGTGTHTGAGTGAGGQKKP
jgi:hypothetical protein